MYNVQSSKELDALLNQLRSAATPLVKDGVERMPLPSELLSEYLGVPVVARSDSE